MAQVYHYRYKGKQITKQEKCKASIPLDKARIWLDFNEVCAYNEQEKAPIYLFSQADLVNDSEGNDIILQTARIYSKAAGKDTLPAVCSRDSLQVLPVCSINYMREWKYLCLTMTLMNQINRMQF